MFEIDEGQFFDPSILGVCFDLMVRHNRDVIVGCLTTDYRLWPFGHAYKLVLLGFQGVKLYATCSRYNKHKSAEWSLRKDETLVNQQVLIGGKEKYVVFCTPCMYKIGRLNAEIITKLPC